MATLFQPDGTERDVRPANGRDFTLAELQGFVGGYIEVVYSYNRRRQRGKILVIDEEGKLKGLPVNARASEIFSSPFEVIVGPALLCRDDEVR